MFGMSSGHFQEGKKAAHIRGEKIAQQVICVYKKRKRYILTHPRAKRAELLPGISNMETLLGPQE